MAASGTLWKELFTGTTGNPDLNTHTPDEVAGGATSGLWQGTGGVATINSTLSVLQDGANNNGNRRFTQNLGRAEYVIEADFASLVSGPSRFWGVIVRGTDASGTQRVECIYDTGLGQYLIEEIFAGGRKVTLTEAAPVGTVRFRVEVSDARVDFYVAGVLKLSLTAPPNAGTGTFCGVIVGNFQSGSALPTMSCSFYEIRTLPVPPPVNSGNGAVMRAALW